MVNVGALRVRDGAGAAAGCHPGVAEALVQNQRPRSRWRARAGAPRPPAATRSRRPTPTWHSGAGAAGGSTSTARSCPRPEFDIASEPRGDEARLRAAFAAVHAELAVEHAIELLLRDTGLITAVAACASELASWRRRSGRPRDAASPAARARDQGLRPPAQDRPGRPAVSRRTRR